MATDIRKRKVSELPEATDTSGFWIFGSKTVGGIMTSVKFAFDNIKSLFGVIQDIVIGDTTNVLSSDAVYRLIKGETNKTIADVDKKIDSFTKTMSDGDKVTVVDNNYPYIENSAVTDGQISANVNFRRTGFIDCSEWALNIEVSKAQYSLCSFFTSNSLSSYIPNSGYGTDGSVEYDITLQKPATAKYVIFNDRKTLSREFTVKVNTSLSGTFVLSDNVLFENELLTDFLKNLPNGKRTDFKDKVISVMGTSISTFPYVNVPGLTREQMWWSILIAELQAKEGVINGVSGSSVSNVDANSFINRYKNIDFSGTDILIMEGGMNDLGASNIPLGVFDYETSLSAQSSNQFIPAYRKIIEGLQTDYPSLKICIATISSRSINQTSFPWVNPTTNNSWIEYNEAIRRLVKDYGLKATIDFAASGINFFNAGSLTTDRVHPNIDGQNLLGQKAIIDIYK